MGIKIALAGNPNCGKTTLFNALTGANQSVGNWPGVTVERKEGRLRWNRDVVITDLPGVYSLTPYTPEERVTRDYLLNDRPDAIINIVDGVNLERNLFLTTQLAELGLPVVIALNMADIMEKRGISVDSDKLSSELSMPVRVISALKGTGVKEAAEAAVSAAGQPCAAHKKIFSQETEAALAEIEALMDRGPASRFRAVKAFEGDEAELARCFDPGKASAAALACCAALDDDAESVISAGRYGYISDLLGRCAVRKACETRTLTDRIDAVATNRVLALPIFAAVMFAVYYISVTTVGALVTDWTNDVLFGEIIPPAAEGFLEAHAVAPWLSGLILNGIIGGVGAVLGFVPQMFVLFALLALLEYSGYMARVAFIMDRIFRNFGLSGKSFIPMLVGTGCSVPGIMASRTIENENDRRMTIITTSFMPCGAKLPIIALIAGALFDGRWWVAPSAYLTGIASIIISGLILKKTALFAGNAAPFVMELPDYHMPSLGAVARSTWERGFSFIKKAGTVIMLSVTLVWAASQFGFENGSFIMVEELSDSLLAKLGHSAAWIFEPLGWGSWQAAVAAFTGLIAKENVVGTFGVLFGFGEVAEDGAEIWKNMAAHFTVLSAYSFLLFNLLCAPCFAAIGAIRREMNSGMWTCFAVAYQTAYAYCTALIVYQAGLFIQTGAFTAGTAAASALLMLGAWLVFRPTGGRALKAELAGEVRR